MVNYIIRRLVISFFMVIGIGLVSFVIIQLPPGDFASSYQQFLVNQSGMSEVDAEALADRLRVRYGLDKPIPEQFATWMVGIVTRGEFGFSLAHRKDVGELIKERLPKTLFLALSAHAISTIFGLILGIYTAPRQYGLADNMGSVLAFMLTSVPRFWIALVIIYILIFSFDQTEVNSFYSPEYSVAPWSAGKVIDMLKHVWPAILIAGLGGVARNMRVMRGNLLDVLNSQYVTTARSKGLTENRVMYGHAVPNALHPLIAYQGTVLPYMLQGELEAAIILSLPTMGPLFYDSLLTQDIYISGSFLLIYGVLIVLGNLISDIALAIFDPRIRFA